MDALLEGLDPTQRDAVTSRAAPLAILAGAGSGKTRVLTRRIAWQSSEELIDPAHVLAVTFTRKAAGELRARLARLGVRESVTAGTFHAIALAQLRRRADEQGRTMPELLDRKVRILMRLLPNRGREGALAAAEIASEIEWAKARLVKPDGYEAAVTLAGRATPRPPAEVAGIFASYEREKRKRGLVDFDDLISGCADVLERDADFAAAQRWRFRHLFVDEFQDASAAQFRLLRAWLGDRSDLCVVGDPDQAIYGFAGADASYLGGFRRVFPTERFPHVGVVQLGSNYRSSPQVVAAATAVLGPPGRRRREVHAARPDGPLPTFIEYASADDEARGDRPRAPRRRERAVAVVAHGRALPRQRAVGAVRGGAHTRRHPVPRARRRTLPRTPGGPGRARRAARRRTRGDRHRPFAEHLTDMTTDAESVAEERREHVDALVRLGHEYLEADGGRGSVDGFLEFLQTSLRGDDAGNSSGNAVELLTFHRAKGLEFDTVFVTGLERGLVPISHAKTPEAMDEEQRLLYVALSRAERGLHLTLGARAHGGRSRGPSHSEQLDPAGRGRRPPARARRSGARRRRARQHRQRARPRRRAKGGSTRTKSPTDVADSDAPLYEALVDWRLRLSRAASAPAYVIFPNTTLAAIATARPRTPSALLDVPGVGPVKADRYGEAVLALVAEHAS